MSRGTIEREIDLAIRYLSAPSAARQVARDRLRETPGGDEAADRVARAEAWILADLRAIRPLAVALGDATRELHAADAGCGTWASREEADRVRRAASAASAASEALLRASLLGGVGFVRVPPQSWRDAIGDAEAGRLWDRLRRVARAARLAGWLALDVRERAAERAGFL